MKLLCGTLQGWKSALFFCFLSLVIPLQAQAKLLKNWLYWNSYAEWESYSSQTPDNEYDAGSSLSLFSTGLDAYYGKFSGHIYAVYREDITEPAEIERVQMIWTPTTWLSLSAGQNYLPFSYIDTLSVSYAPTASLGLTFRENITLSMYSEHFHFSAYTYKSDLKYWDLDLELESEDQNGATDKALDHYGADATVSFADNLFTLGASYMTNLGDSDLLAAIFPATEYMTETVPVSALYASLFWRRLGFIVEAIEANKEFGPYDFDGYLDGLRFRATNAEMAIYANPDAWLLFGYRTTYMAKYAGLPAKSYVVGFTNAFYNKQVHIGFELNSTKEYASANAPNKSLYSKGFAFKLALSY